MQEFPDLHQSQVALLRAATKTGHILDINFKKAAIIDQNVYSLFEDIEGALRYAKDIVVHGGDIECIIYGKNKAMIYFITPYNVNAI